MFWTRQRTQGILLILAGGFGVLTVIGFVVVIGIAMYVPADKAPAAASTAPPPRAAAPAASDMFGTIEIGASGIKGIVWHITAQEVRDVFRVAPDAQAARYRIFAHAMVKHYKDYNTDMQNERKAADAAQRVAIFIARMKADRVPEADIFIVASSGVAGLPDMARIQSEVTRRTGRTPDVITADRECQYTFDWIVPTNEIYNSAAIDVGSGNTKACYVERDDDYGSRSRALELLPYGTKTFAKKVLAKQRPNEDFAHASARIVRPLVDPLIAEAVDGDPGLRTRHRVYLSGGGAWVTAMLVHPDRKDAEYVPLSAPKDFADLRKSAAAGTADLESLGDPFTADQLVAGLDVLAAISRDLNLQRREVIFPAAARDAWMSNYLMLKLAGTGTAQNE